MAAHVAGLEPDMAANMAQAPRLEITNPPGTRVNHRSRASYKSAPARVEEIEAPIIINIGIDNRAKLSNLPKNISGIKANDGAPSKIMMNKAETTSKPMPTDIPEKRIKIVLVPTKAPKIRGSINLLLSRKVVQFLRLWRLSQPITEV